jgi:topoisomerase-4 subunit A
MNVLDARATPRVMGLKEALQAFLDHRREVIVRRARFRLGKIEQRLHILAGLLIVFLNLDEVIRIVRYEDEPKAKLMAAFEIDDTQADAILNTRLRQLAKLEEMELRREHADLAEERDGIQGMLASDKMQWKLVGEGLRHVRDLLGPKTELGRRRSTFAEAPEIDADAAVEALVAREPITVILSEKGWIRAARGRIDDPSELKFKEGDALAHLVPAETTDKLLLFASDGRFFTLAGDKLPSARGQGEPLRLLLDLDDRVEILALFPFRPGGKRVLASKAGYGFIMPEDEAVAMRRAGKQVLHVDAKGACFCLPIDGDHLAVVGDNGKALIFPLAELPEMPRGKGVKLQSYREGALRDGLVFAAAEGAAWTTSDGRSRAWPDWREWLGRRAAAGRLVPKGFPASKRFRPR